MTFEKAKWDWVSCDCFGSARECFFFGDLWGITIEVDHKTSIREFLEFGRVLVSTEENEPIFNSCELKVGNIIYLIKCFEDNLWMAASVNALPLPVQEGKYSEGGFFPESHKKMKPNSVGEVASISHVDESPLECLNTKENCHTPEIIPGGEVNVMAIHTSPSTAPAPENVVVGPSVPTPEKVATGLIAIPTSEEVPILYQEETHIGMHTIPAHTPIPECSVTCSIPIPNSLHQKGKQSGSNHLGPIFIPPPGGVRRKLITSSKPTSKTKRKKNKATKLASAEQPGLNEVATQYSISSSDIRNRNSIIRKEAEMVMETGKLLGFNFGENEKAAIDSIIEMNKEEDNFI